MASPALTTILSVYDGSFAPTITARKGSKRFIPEQNLREIDLRVIVCTSIFDVLIFFPNMRPSSFGHSCIFNVLEKFSAG